MHTLSAIGYIIFFVSIPKYYKNVYARKLAVKGTLFVIFFIKRPRYDYYFLAMVLFIYLTIKCGSLSIFRWTQLSMNLEI